MYVDADSRQEADLQAVVRQMSQTLDLLGAIHPRCLARMRTDISRVYVEPAASSRYLAASNAIGLALRLVRDHDVETIASVLVHEATHVRIAQRGIRSWPDLLPRIERRCLLEQIDFLKKVPQREDLVAHYHAQLERPWWTPQQRFDRTLRYFEELDAPRWFLRAYRFLAKPRTTPS